MKSETAVSNQFRAEIQAWPPGERIEILAQLLVDEVVHTFGTEFLSLELKVMHGKITDMKGQEIDEWQNLAEKFVVSMTKIIDNLLEGEK